MQKCYNSLALGILAMDVVIKRGFGRGGPQPPGIVKAE
jgi:hypothetical protein